MPAIHIDTIYESEAFRLLSRHMEDKHAVGIVYATMISDNGKDTLFRELERMADTLLAEQDEHPRINARFETCSGGVLGSTNANIKRIDTQDDGSFMVVLDHWPFGDKPKAPEPVEAFSIGDLTMELVFKKYDIHNVHDMQLVFNKIEEAFVVQRECLNSVCTKANDRVYDLEARLEQQGYHDKQAIARRDNKISELKAEIAALNDMVKERNLRLANTTHGFHKRLGDVHEKLFHDDPTDTEERVHRFLEEAIEVAHSIYVPLDEVIQLAKYVYQGKRGSLNEELSDAAITLASLCRHRERDFLAVVLEGLRKLESPERIERVRKKRANRKGRGALPGLLDTSGMSPKSVVTEAIGDVMQSRDHSTGIPKTSGEVRDVFDPAKGFADATAKKAHAFDELGKVFNEVADRVIDIVRKI